MKPLPVIVRFTFTGPEALVTTVMLLELY